MSELPSSRRHALEHRIPPPAVALLVAAAMWVSTIALAPLAVGVGIRVGAAAAIWCCAALFGAGGIRAFRRARTTIDPVKLEAASVLVTTGVYRITRNPMYVGLTLLLVGLAVGLAAPWTLVGPAGFVAFTSRFQIVPEERVLRGRFGAAYANYLTSTRRWI